MRRVLFSQLGGHADRMARNKPQANCHQLAFNWVVFVALSLAGNRNAAHPVNAILNYAYAALESESDMTISEDMTRQLE